MKPRTDQDLITIRIDRAVYGQLHLEAERRAKEAGFRPSVNRLATKILREWLELQKEAKP